ncbi:B3 domain-containing protein REM16-like [Chenopodium quinoa]|uniref:B3 domain-containing protein REM16-like n=1 Tax=Chenopodium quinoa TaxID=63459 RepID=UPI000B78FB72|nr:B3 domain-containing protein REM16-like [Chenopodium quinoa]
MKSRTWEEKIYWKNFHFSQFSLTLPTNFHHHLNRRECFEVRLFDGASSCEKEASHFVGKVQQQNSDDDDDDSEESEESLSKGFTDDTRQNVYYDCHNASRNRRRKNPGSRTPKSSSARSTEEKRLTVLCIRLFILSADVSDDQNESDENADEEDSITEEARTTPKKAATTSSARKLPISASRKRNRNGGSRVIYKSNRRDITDAEKVNTERKALLASGQRDNSFTTIPSESNLKSHLRNGQVVSLRMEGKIWDCIVSKSSRNHVGFQCSGWRTFVRDNFLEEFDVCLFVPSIKKNGRYVLDVSIFRVVPEVVPSTLVT